MSALRAQTPALSLNSDNKIISWKVKPAAELPATGAQLSAAGYADQDWVKAIVPGTVFASYVAAGLEKDPNFGDNIHQVDRAKYDRNFWYRSEFSIPANFTRERVWLNFRGVNRKAEVFVNGQRVGQLDGFMDRGQFDITPLLNRAGKNALAVLVHWPQPPMANVASPTYIASGGWDWIPYVPGLNMGITDKVFLSNTGSLTLKDGWVRTQLPSNARADLAVSVEVSNPTAANVQAVVKGLIQPGNIPFSQQVTVPANNVEEVKFDIKRFPQLVVNSPRLWWPNGYGEPNLYTCQLSVAINGKESDQQELQFGIKKYTYDTLGNVLHVHINGVPVFLKGGNWGMSEYLLRSRGEEYDTRVRLHREMNFNIIRNWIGHVTDEEFYEACDKYGIMVWDDFWINSNPNLPRDLRAFNHNVVEKIKRVRNHPSIAVWCGDNEGWPEPPISGWMKESLKAFDGGERYYQANSHADNLTGSGPWGGYDPRHYFVAPPLAIGGNRGWGLRTETGTAVFTNFESFKKFMPQDKWWPRNDMWNLHYFGPQAFNAAPDRYEEMVNTRYGQANGIEDFCRKAQFVNIEVNKAMYEGWLDHIWEDASGIMTWMSQSAYPSMVWQTYDYYFDLTGAYWGAKKACEPLHIQWNPATDAVKVINTTGKDVSGLTAEATVYNLDGKPVKQYSQLARVASPANSAAWCFTLPFSQAKTDLALNKPAVASSTEGGQPTANVTDGNSGTRWASNSADQEWIYIDLGEPKEVGGVGLNWQDAYGKAYKIQTSNDAFHWNDVYSTVDGRMGELDCFFPEVKARYVRMLGMERGSWWGYSLWDFKVYEGNVASEDLSDVHFIRLSLKDAGGKVVSDNFYWRGNKRKDFTALNLLPKINLQTSSKLRKADGKYWLTAQITNPAASKAIAFGIRVQAVRPDGEQVLPSLMNDNYFSLLPGESKEIVIECKESDAGGTPKLKVELYNNYDK